MSYSRIRAGRGIEDTVVIEVPGVPDVALRRIQRRRQSDVDEIATLATLILHAGREGNGRRGESSSHRNCHHKDTEDRDSQNHDPLFINIVRICIHVRVSHRHRHCARSKTRLFGNAVVTLP